MSSVSETAPVEADTATEDRPAGNRFRFPHIYVILFALITLAAAATYLVPAGVYDLVPGPQGREVVDPDSFHFVDPTPVTAVQYMTAIPRGLVAAAEVVAFTFIIGGAFAVLRATGIIELGVARLARRFSRRGLLTIPLLMVVFATVATFIGTQELSLVYIPVILPLMLALRFDSVTAAAVALCATTAGFSAALTSPVTVGLGQQIAGLPLYSGMALRAVLLVVMTLIAILYVMRYAAKVRRDPAASLVHAEDRAGREAAATDAGDGAGDGADGGGDAPAQATARQKAAAWVLLGFAALLLYGVLAQGWFMMEMAGLFIAMGVVVGLVAGLGVTRICDAFTEGLRSVLLGAVIVGVARGVAVMLQDGQILDTVVHGLAAVTSGLPTLAAPVGMLAAQSLFNFLVPSGSGQAVITMPIMAPLSDILGVTRQTAVLAFQLGDGPSNIFYPTSGYFMAALALAGVPWTTWVRFVWPLLLMWLAVGAVALVIAQAIAWGPF
jgi:uncharacterized ion transporter superfamily protein YfcC